MEIKRRWKKAPLWLKGGLIGVGISIENFEK